MAADWGRYLPLFKLPFVTILTFYSSMLSSDMDFISTISSSLFSHGVKSSFRISCNFCLRFKCVYVLGSGGFGCGL